MTKSEPIPGLVDGLLCLMQKRPLTPREQKYLRENYLRTERHETPRQEVRNVPGKEG